VGVDISWQLKSSFSNLFIFVLPLRNQRLKSNVECISLLPSPNVQTSGSGTCARLGSEGKGMWKQCMRVPGCKQGRWERDDFSRNHNAVSM
jgi:hypothetical protein